MTTSDLSRPIRSFVRRQGRMTSGQQRAIAQGWSRYGLNLPSEQSYYCWQTVFNRQAPTVVEIGFGNGDTLIALAQAHPEINFVGIEVHQPGVGHCLHLAQALGLNNLKVFCEDAIKVLTLCVAPLSVDKVLLLFPDPWPKNRHNKRRIVQPAFVDFLSQKIKSDGFFQLATDWQPYADHMLAVLQDCPAFSNIFAENTFAPHGFQRIQTKFERRGEKLGHAIYDLVFKRR